MKLKTFFFQRTGFTPAFRRGFMRGLNACAELHRTHRYTLDTRSDVEQMRSDWEQIGDDFREVIAREYGRLNSIRR